MTIPTLSDYEEFLRSKVKLATNAGLSANELFDLNPVLMPHQRAGVEWLVIGGRRALFYSFGLGKTIMQLEACRIAAEAENARSLIVCPLGVKQEFIRDAKKILKWKKPPKFIRRIEEAGPTGVYITNYETVRDGKLDPAEFVAVSLDEAAILRGFGGSKTFREFMLQCTGDGGPSGRMRTDGKTVKYRYVATATPSPNDYIELLAYAEFLGVMDVSQAKTRFFKRDSTQADKLTLHPHKEEEFWLWVASWALFVQKPSDLGFSDEGYTLPEMEVNWHCVSTLGGHAGFDRSGQGKLMRDAAIDLQDASREKRDSLPIRVAKAVELRNASPGRHCVLWHDLEAERHAIQEALPDSLAVWGNQDTDEREDRILDFSDGKFATLSTKPVIAGAGCNFQRHCSWSIFVGIGFKFADFIQAVHRFYRFLQTEKVRIDIIYTEAEYAVKRTLERKWQQHKIMVDKMSSIIKKFGLSRVSMVQHLTRRMGIQDIREVSGTRYRLVNDDCIKQAWKLEDNCIDLGITSIPFGNQYEYSPNYADLGHSEDPGQFFQQMDFLTPQLYRSLKPGRLFLVHVKDRIVPMGLSGMGFQTVYPFHMEVTSHFTKHGFGYMGMKTIVTDVVRENNQTYRLSYTQQCDDGTKMSWGMPEYLLMFRKPPTDRSNAFADEPVVKAKDAYSLGRWQVDAHGFTRSSGNRLLAPEDLRGLSHADIFQLFKAHSLENIYDFEAHVRLADKLREMDMLPVTFMLLQPQSWSPEVWTDITRMLTLNSTQAAKGQEQHLCPLQFDIVDRAIEQYSQPGETVLDPFAGIGTVPYRAVLKGRKGLGFELNSAYFVDAASYCAAAESEVTMPDLFNLASISQ